MFEQHQVDGLLSIAHLLPRSRGRTGIYVLTFSDGCRYVGQALNMVGRFAAHRRRWDDIVAVDVCRIPASDLDVIERETILEHGRRKLALRNVTYALGDPTGASDLDWLIERDDQLSWLNGSTWLADNADRVADETQRVARRPGYVCLSQRPDCESLLRVARSYIQFCVPQPRATEMTFWAASAMSGMNRSTWPRLITVSINKMETLVIGHYKSRPDEIWCFVNVGREYLDGSAPNWHRDLSVLGAEPTERVYEAAGGDSVRLEFRSLDELARALAQSASPVVAAARELNLRLMRKGPTFQWRWHCFDLADHLV